MTDQQHPITPPPQLVQEWLEALYGPLKASNYDIELTTRAAQWGADQELEAGRQWLEINGAPREFIDGLLAARRPKPPSLKELALARLEKMEQLIADLEKAGLLPFLTKDDSIRRALEALPND